MRWTMRICTAMLTLSMVGIAMHTTPGAGAEPLAPTTRTVRLEVTIPQGSADEVWLGVGRNPRVAQLTKVNDVVYTTTVKLKQGTKYYYTRGTATSADTGSQHTVKFPVQLDAVWGWKDSSDPISRPGFQKGVVLGGMLWRPGDLPLVGQSLDIAQSYGVNWITIIPDWFIVPDHTGSVIKPVYATDGPFPNTSNWIAPTLTDQQILSIIKQARQRGMKIFLKPHVDPITYSPEKPQGRGDSNPADWPAWYASYEQMVLHYAALAQQAGVEMLAVGTEIDPAAHEGSGQGPQGGGQTQFFRQLISKVRSVYSGKLTYSVSAGKPERAAEVKFWDALDYIGFEPYFPMTTTPNAGIQTLTADFGRTLDRYAKPLAEQYGKQVIFTEASIHSFDGSTSVDPLGPPDGRRVVDHMEQALGLEALMQAAVSRAYIAGVYYWALYLVPSANDLVSEQANDAYDPITGKLGGQVLSKWYHRIVA